MEVSNLDRRNIAVQTSMLGSGCTPMA